MSDGSSKLHPPIFPARPLRPSSADGASAGAGSGAASSSKSGGGSGGSGSESSGRSKRDEIFDRLVKLDRLLLGGGGSLQLLSKKLSVREKTLRRDIKVLRRFGSDAKYQDKVWRSTVAAFVANLRFVRGIV